MLSRLSREASAGMLFTKGTHCEKSLELVARTTGSVVRVPSVAQVTAPCLVGYSSNRANEKPQTARPAVCATCFVRRGSRRTVMKKYRSERKGRRNFDTALHYNSL